MRTNDGRRGRIMEVVVVAFLEEEMDEEGDK